MKVAHFCYDDTCGAQGAAYELHSTLRRVGVDSTMFVFEKTRDDPTVLTLQKKYQPLDSLLNTYRWRHFSQLRRKGAASIALDYPGLNLDEESLDEMKEFDLFHLHWVPGLLTAEDIGRLCTLGKPVLWTMHDFHPFTGACHYPEECVGYTQDCSNCLLMTEDAFGIPKAALRVKEKYYRDIRVIITSEWMRDVVRSSRVFHEAEIEKIPLGIDVEAFKPVDRVKAREALGFQADAKIILIGAQSVSQNVKGYPFLHRALEIVAADEECAELIRNGKLFLATFGRNMKYLSEFPLPSSSLGFISDRSKLARLYSAADMFIFPSIQETFGMTALEAMACGTPVLAFDTCAMREVIQDGVNGYKSPAGDFHHLAENILRIIKEDAAWGGKVRESVLKEYSLELEARRMAECYKRVAVSNKKVKSERASDIPYIDPLIVPALKPAIADLLFLQYETGEGCRLFPTFDKTPLLGYIFHKVNYLIELGLLDQKDKLILYGTGEQGVIYTRVLNMYEIPIAAYTDSNPRKWGTEYMGKPIVPPAELHKLDYTKLLISCAACEEIQPVLTELGLQDKDGIFAPP